MSAYVGVHTRAHTVTHVTNKLLYSLKEIIRESGLSPAKLTQQWGALERGISTWLRAEDLTRVILEVYDPRRPKELVHRWDFDIDYNTPGDGSMWVDTDEIKYNIKKAGLFPSQCTYRFVVTTKAGAADVEGWRGATPLSTEGFVRQNLGTSIDGSGIRAGAAYWRKK